MLLLAEIGNEDYHAIEIFGQFCGDYMMKMMQVVAPLKAKKRFMK